jgi:hypothetical protein
MLDDVEIIVNILGTFMKLNLDATFKKNADTDSKYYYENKVI